MNSGIRVISFCFLGLLLSVGCQSPSPTPTAPVVPSTPVAVIRLPLPTVTAAVSSPTPQVSTASAEPTWPVPTATSEPTRVSPTTIRAVLPAASNTPFSTIPIQSLPSNAKDLESVGWIGGAARAVAVEGHYAYVSTGPRMLVFDVANPDQPRVMGQSAVLPNLILDMKVVGNYAYVAAGETDEFNERLYVFNVANPKQPTLLGSTAIPGNAVHLAVVDGNIYLAEIDTVREGRVHNGGLRIFHIASPAHLTELSFVERAGGYDNVTVVGRYAYAVGNSIGGGMHIIDITDAAHPQEVGVYIGVGSSDVSVAGDYAYIAVPGGPKAKSFLHVVNVSNPAQPTRVSLFEISGALNNMKVRATNHYAYIVVDNRLTVLDTSDPAQLKMVSISQTQGAGADVSLAGDFLYLTGEGGNTLRIVNIARPEQPLVAGAYHTPNFINAVAVVGHYAFAAAHTLDVVDISDPRSPIEVARMGLKDAGALSMAIQGNLAYVGTIYGLEIISIADPIHLTQVGYIKTGRVAQHVAVSGDYVFATDYDHGVRVFDVSDPANPTLVNTLEQPTWKVQDVAVADHYAYVTGENALRVIDISDAAHLSVVGVFDLQEWMGHIRVVGHYAYLASNKALRIIDIMNPAKPVEVGAIPITPSDFVIAGDYAFVSTAHDFPMLHLVNISDPARPTEVAARRTLHDAQSITLATDYIYMADRTSGLAILRPVAKTQ